MFHITDWFTTMLRLADADLSGLDVDGLDQWETLLDPSSCKSKIIFYYSLFSINLFSYNTILQLLALSPIKEPYLCKY